MRSKLLWLPLLSMDPPENFGWAVAVVFPLAMCPMHLVVVIGNPTIMLDAHLFPRFAFCKVKITHSALNIEGRLDIAHPGLPLRNEFFPYAERFVDLHRLLGFEDGTIITDQGFWRTMQTDGGVQDNQIGCQILFGGNGTGENRSTEIVHDGDRINRVWPEQMVFDVAHVHSPVFMAAGSFERHRFRFMGLLLWPFQAVQAPVEEPVFCHRSWERA